MKLTDDAPVSVAAGTIEVTVGAVVSMMMALFALSEPAAPGAGSVKRRRVRAIEDVPPFSASEVVAG